MKKGNLTKYLIATKMVTTYRKQSKLRQLINKIRNRRK